MKTENAIVTCIGALCLGGVIAVSNMQEPVKPKTSEVSRCSIPNNEKETWLAADGCNHCHCEAEAMICTTDVCK